LPPTLFVCFANEKKQRRQMEIDPVQANIPDGMILTQQPQQMLLLQQLQSQNRVTPQQGAQPMLVSPLTQVQSNFSQQPFSQSQIDHCNNMIQDFDNNNNNIPLQSVTLTSPSVLEELLLLQFHDNPILAHQ
ncbi:hypothetical protein RFI_36738, partial [Reticulomyxa filosa]